jgi:hypothetical protein
VATMLLSVRSPTAATALGSNIHTHSFGMSDGLSVRRIAKARPPVRAIVARPARRRAHSSTHGLRYQYRIVLHQKQNAFWALQNSEFPKPIPSLDSRFSRFRRLSYMIT